MDGAVDVARGQGILPSLKEGNKAAARAAGKLGRALAMRGHPSSQVRFLANALKVVCRTAIWQTPNQDVDIWLVAQLIS